MNQYQKLAVLLLRLFGAVVAVVGVMGPLYIGFLVALGKDAPTYGPDRWAKAKPGQIHFQGSA